MANIEAIPVSQWSIGFHHPTRSTVLAFEWTDRAPLNFAIPEEHAVALARAILENYATTPPRRDQMS